MAAVLYSLFFISLLAYGSGLPKAESEITDFTKDLAQSSKIKHNVQKRAVGSTHCLKTLYIMAFTSGTQNFTSKAGPSIEILASGHVRHVRLYDKPGEDMTPDKGDLWKFEFTHFHFPFCPTLSRIQRVYVVERTEDPWHIESIVTLVRDKTYKRTQILTQNLDVNRWIVGESDHSYRRLELTKA